MAELYLNRELSWLKFNERVLEEACDRSIPLLERLKFAAIFASNLDEFYMVRVGSLLDQTLIRSKRRDNKTGMLPQEQIDAVNRAVTELCPYRDNAYVQIMKDLRSFSVCHIPFRELDGGEKRRAKAYFENEVLPLLSPQIIDMHHPFPHMENRKVYVGVRLKSREGKLFGILPMPREVGHVHMITDRGFVLLEDLVLRYADIAFSSCSVESRALFRVTRNADINVTDALFDEDIDYREYMQEILKKRGKLSPVRLETSTFADTELTAFFLSRLGLGVGQCFVNESPLDMGFVGELETIIDSRLRERLLYPPVRPQWPACLRRGPVMPQLVSGDVLLSYPFESMRPFVDLIREASEDPRVISIQMTLYRIGSQSQIVQSLCAAAENGKDVTAIVELRARFDEQNNINWSNVLEDAGCRVIYGLDQFKVHGKLLLITLHGPHGVETITDIATGNYNESTARQYTDLSLITADPEVGEDAAEFFRNMKIGDIYGKYRRLLVSPSTFKTGMLGLIDGEIRKAREGRSARIIAKMNSLTDKEIIDRLIAASGAGVQIRLIIRGICCLRPGVPGFTENIEVRSIVGRFLEHSRFYLFGEGEDRVSYISSADLMTRNTERRVEIALPVRDPRITRRLSEIADMLLRDNAKARVLGPDGRYIPAECGGERHDSQMELVEQAYRQAEKAVNAPDGKRRPGLFGFFRRLFGRKTA